MRLSVREETGGAAEAYVHVTSDGLEAAHGNISNLLTRNQCYTILQ